MFTDGEIKAISVDEYRDAINSTLSKTLLTDGKIDIGKLQNVQIAHVIDCLRHFLVLTGGNIRRQS